MSMSLWGAIKRALSLFSRRDRRILLLVAVAQVFVSFLDLVGVLLLGLVAASAAAAATGSELSFGGLGAIVSGLPSGTGFVIGLAFAAAIVLVSKSILSLLITRRAFRFIANRQAMVASELARRLLSRPLLEVQNRSSQETSVALTAGVNALTINTVGPALVMVAEISLVTALFAGLLFVDPLVAIFTLVFFGLLTVLLQFALGRWARSLGQRQSVAEMGSMTSIQHALRVYREVTVTGRRNLFVKRFAGLRWEAANVQADTFILSQIGKYVFEIGLIVGAGLLVVLMAVTRDVTAAVAIITVFLAASSRIFPSLLRLQNATTNIRNSEGQSIYTYALIDELDAAEKSTKIAPVPEATAQEFNEAVHSGFPGFVSEVHVHDVSLHYPGAAEFALKNVTLRINSGESVAFVGTTGAGKSTLADAILGVLIPDSGHVTISGASPAHTVQQWPGAMAYVPQDVAVLTGTVRENVALGIPFDDIDDSLVWEALDRAQLSAFLRDNRDGLDTVVGENGVQLSGGQRQRLGIARALYSRPRLLILDEATSALDAETERAVTDTLDSLVGDVTLILIAHRLATVRHCNQVIYLRAGSVVGSGTFEEVRAQVPEFDAQATLLGIEIGAA